MEKILQIEKLKTEELDKYKYLIDEVFEGSNDIEVYRENYEENSNYDIIVAKEDDKILGSVTVYKIDLFTYSFQPALELFNIAVLKEYRGRKIAKILLEYIIDYAKENGYKSIYLNCLKEAYGAHKLYESLGFEKADSLKYNLTI